MAAKKRSKKSTPRKKEKGSPIHVRIETPKYVRKEILSTAIGLIELLKRYEAYTELGKHKETLLRLLKEEVNEVKRLMKDFKLRELPLTGDQVDKLYPSKKEKKRKRAVKKAVEKVEEEREEVEERKIEAEKIAEVRESIVDTGPIDKLEADLAALKDKLAKI